MDFLGFDKDFNREDYLDGLEAIAYQLKEKNFKEPRALEIGTGWGNSAYFMLNKFKDMTLTSIDVNRELASIVELRRIFPDRFTSISPEEFSPLAKYQYIYIDGGHTYEEVKRDIERFVPLLSNRGVLAFDDYGNPGHICGVQEAVDKHLDKTQFSKMIEVGNQTRIIIFVR